MASGTPDLLTLVRTAAAQVGGAPLLQVGDEAVTAEQCRSRVEAVARGLRAIGFAPGDRLVVLLPRCLDEAIVLLAAAAAGGIAVPVHGKLKDDQIAHVLADCEPFAVVTSRTRLLALQSPAATLGNVRVLGVGEELGIASRPLPCDVDGAGDELVPPPGTAAAVLLYTSGSTGPAKGIVQDHHNLALGAAIVAGYLGLRRDDHILGLLSFSFDYGLNQLLSALHAGCRITAADHLGVGELAAARRYQSASASPRPSRDRSGRRSRGPCRLSVGSPELTG
jgi:acyl-CoA synthetase (AMP-forming)/AMP-acid ligase II